MKARLGLYALVAISILTLIIANASYQKQTWSDPSEECEFTLDGEISHLLAQGFDQDQLLVLNNDTHLAIHAYYKSEYNQLFKVNLLYSFDEHGCLTWVNNE